MSLFQDYKRSFAAAQEAPSEEVQQLGKSYLLNAEYVEKCASALEFLAESGFNQPSEQRVYAPEPSTAFGKGLGEKLANLAKIKKFMAEGMSLEDSAKKAYPEYSKEQLAELVSSLSGKMQPKSEKLANLAKIKQFMSEGMSLEDAAKKAYPEYSEEQLAELISSLSGKMSAAKKMAPARAMPPAQMQSKKMQSDETGDEFKMEEGDSEKKASLFRLRSRINEKLADKRQAEDGASDAHITNILSRISGLHEQFVSEGGVLEEQVEEPPQASHQDAVEDAELSAAVDRELTTQIEDESAWGSAETETSEGSESGLASRLRERLQARQEAM